MSDKSSEVDAEFDVMRVVYVAMKDLPADAQQRVLDYVMRRLQLTPDERHDRVGSTFSPRALVEEYQQQTREETSTEQENDDGIQLEGVSPVAQKWTRRNSLSSDQLSQLFSLGVDEIELLAKSVPGGSKRERMHSVLLLLGAASYLGTGAARISYDKIKETLGHYNAYDGTNFATYLKAFAPEVTGSRDAGYTLTARGLAAAAELIKRATRSK